MTNEDRIDMINRTIKSILEGMEEMFRIIKLTDTRIDMLEEKIEKNSSH